MAADRRIFGVQGDDQSARAVPHQHATGAERVARFEDALLSSGIVVRQGERLRFLHESFRSYLRAEQLVKGYNPSDGEIWRAINPFVEGWDVVVFVIELWKQGYDIAGAVRDLLAFGDDGFRAISTFASRLPTLPSEIVQLAVGRWTRLDDGFWEAGIIDGPVDQLGLIAFNYEEARAALRKIAAESGTYFEDAAYAARALARAGDVDEGRAALDAILHDTRDASTHRALAAELIGEIGAPRDAIRAIRSLLMEWEHAPPEMDLACIHAGNVLYRYGRKREALSLFNRLSLELTSDLDLWSLAEAYADLGQTR
jgi:tetratricopeptide (TPR) repeat protein